MSRDAEKEKSDDSKESASESNQSEEVTKEDQAAAATEANPVAVNGITNGDVNGEVGQQDALKVYNSWLFSLPPVSEGVGTVWIVEVVCVWWSCHLSSFKICVL